MVGFQCSGPWLSSCVVLCENYQKYAENLEIRTEVNAEAVFLVNVRIELSCFKVY